MLDIEKDLIMYIASLPFLGLATRGSIEFYFITSDISIDTLAKFLEELRFPRSLGKIFIVYDDIPKHVERMTTTGWLGFILLGSIPSVGMLLLFTAVLVAVLLLQPSNVHIILYCVFWIFVHFISLLYAWRFGRALREMKDINSSRA